MLTMIEDAAFEEVSHPTLRRVVMRVESRRRRAPGSQQHLVFAGLTLTTCSGSGS
jgi:hypothetical protein